jgi:hypothetical protein
MKIFAVALVFALQTLPSFAADLANYVKLDPEHVDCDHDIKFVIHYHHEPIFSSFGASFPLAKDCRALLIEAKESDKELLFNVDTGDLLLDDGNFHIAQPEPRTRRDVMLESPADLQCALRPAFHANYRGETLYAGVGGAVPLRERCNAVRLSADDGGDRVILNLDSGELRPAQGFFRHR